MTAAGGSMSSPRGEGSRRRLRRGAAATPATATGRPLPSRGALRGLHLFPRLLHGSLVRLPALQVDVRGSEHVGVADRERLRHLLVGDLAGLDRGVGGAVVEVVRQAEAGLVVDVRLHVLVSVVVVLRVL